MRSAPLLQHAIAAPHDDDNQHGQQDLAEAQRERSHPPTAATTARSAPTGRARRVPPSMSLQHMRRVGRKRSRRRSQPRLGSATREPHLLAEAPAHDRADRRGRRSGQAPARGFPVQNSPVNRSSSVPSGVRPGAARTMALKPRRGFRAWIALRRTTSSGVLRPERVEHRLAGARGVDAPLDAEPRDQVLEAEAGGITPIEPTIELRVGEDLVGGAGEPVAAGGAPRPRRRRSTGTFFSAASAGSARRSAPTAPANRPGELIDSATALAPADGEGRARAPARGRQGEAAAAQRRPGR